MVGVDKERTYPPHLVTDEQRREYDQHHRPLKEVFVERDGRWVVPAEYSGQWYKPLVAMRAEDV